MACRGRKENPILSVLQKGKVIESITFWGYRMEYLWFLTFQSGWWMYWARAQALGSRALLQSNSEGYWLWRKRGMTGSGSWRTEYEERGEKSQTGATGRNNFDHVAKSYGFDKWKFPLSLLSLSLSLSMGSVPISAYYNNTSPPPGEPGSGSWENIKNFRPLPPFMLTCCLSQHLSREEAVLRPPRPRPISTHKQKLLRLHPKHIYYRNYSSPSW